MTAFFGLAHTPPPPCTTRVGRAEGGEGGTSWAPQGLGLLNLEEQNRENPVRVSAGSRAPRVETRSTAHTHIQHTPSRG